MTVDIRLMKDHELDAVVRAVRTAFGEGFEESELSLIRDVGEDDRTLVAFDGDQVVGHATAFSLDIGVPGGRMPVAVVDAVAVLPTHRRQGILTRLMERQLADMHERGEALSGLGASESLIYGRFGYGIGSLQVDYSIERQYTAFAHAPEVKGSLRLIDKAEGRQVFPEVTDRACADRPGYIKGKGAFWDWFLADLEHRRGGASTFFHVVYEEDGRVDGYATYRIRGDTVVVHELMPVTDAAHAALWRYCFDIDLRQSTVANKRPVDDPLPWMLADPRRLTQSVRDDLWLRLVDVPAALSGRRYTGEGKLVLEVRDDFCQWNEGRYLLEGSPEGAQCKTTDAAPDAVLSVADLAACYLGAVGFRTLAQAARVEGEPKALRKADALFATDVAPWWPNEF